MTRAIARSILITVAIAAARAQAPSGLAIGAPAPGFSLPGTDGKTHTLGEYSGANVLAVVFTCNSCPVSQLYEDRIAALYRDFRGKSVAVVAINPNSPRATRLDEQSFSDVTDSLEDMKIRVEFRHIEYPYLYDGDTQAVSQKFGPVVTPQIFVFDRDRKLRYAGGLDDSRSAIEALLAGQPVAVPTTTAAGCSPKWLSRSSGVADELAGIEAEPVALTAAGAEELKKLRANPTGKLLLVNFWATWCGPCVSEFPDIQATYRMYRNREFAFVTVSENDPKEKAGVLKVLQTQHASGVNLIFATADTSALEEAFDHNMGAAVPFTVLIAPNGDIVYQEEGEVTILALRRAILENLPEPKEYPGQQAYWTPKQEEIK